MTRYWLDASSLIWADRDLFPVETMHRYWDWLETKFEDGSVVTHKKIFQEVIKGADGEKPSPLAKWVKNRKGVWCSHGCTDESKALMGEISKYCWDRYGFEVANSFLCGADALLIAVAALDGGVVVTQESVQKEPRIPSVCDKFKVKHMPINRMNIVLGMTFG
jgi:hypothetical protein